MPSEACVPSSDGSIAFSYKQDDVRVDVALEFTRSEDEVQWQAFVKSRLLQYYVGPFCSKRVEGRLDKLKIFYLRMVDNVVDSAFVETTIVNAVGQTFTTPLLLRCPSAAVLIVFRTHVTGPDGTSRPREYVTLVQEKRRAISQGYPDTPEIPWGRFNQGRLSGSQISAVEKTCNIALIRNDLDTLENRSGNNWGVNSNPVAACDNIEIYLYRKTIGDADLDQMQQRIAATAEQPVSVQLVPLGNAWKATTDLKSLTGLFFFLEFRYHKRMPRYTPPTGFVQPQRVEPPAVPQWSKIKDLDPNGSGYNLMAKVVKGAAMKAEGSRRGTIVIGDETGVVTLSLSGPQLQSPGIGQVGHPVVVQNATVDMASGHIRLFVSQWGILSTTPEPDKLPDFNFEVNSANDVSSTIYELDNRTRRAPLRQRRGGGVSVRRGGPSTVAV